MSKALPAVLLLLIAAVVVVIVTSDPGGNGDPNANGGNEIGNNSTEGPGPAPSVSGASGGGRTEVSTPGSDMAPRYRPDLPEAGLQLRVLAAEGGVLADARIEIDLDAGKWLSMPPQNPDWIRSARPPSMDWPTWFAGVTDEEGLARFDAPIAGKDLLVWVSAPGRTAASLPVRPLQPGESRDLGEVTLNAGHSVRVTVLDPEGRPVPEAQVELGPPRGADALQAGYRAERRRGICDKQGQAALPGVPSGVYELEVFARGFLLYTDKALELAAPARDHEIEVTMDPGFTLAGRVTDANGKPVPGARVAAVMAKNIFAGAWFAPEQLLAEGFACDSNGRFRIGGLEGRTRYQVEAAAPGFGMAQSSEVKPNSGEEAEIVLMPEVMVTGTVMMTDGQLVDGARVDLLPASYDEIDLITPGVTTNGTGQFEIMATQPGRYHLQVRSWAGPLTRVENLQVKAGMQPVEVVIEGKAPLGVRVMNEYGERLKDVQVEVSPRRRSEGAAYSRKARTNEQGEARFYSLDQNAWLVQVSAEGTAQIERTVQRYELVEQWIDVILPAPGTLLVHVASMDGQPLSRFPVVVRPLDPQKQIKEGERLTDIHGTAVWNLLEPGEYFVHAKDPTNKRFRLMNTGTEPGQGESGDTNPAAESQEIGNKVTVLPGQVVESVLKLEDHAILTAKVEGAGAVAGAWVYLLPDRDPNRGASFSSLAIASERTGADGRAKLSPVWSDKYRVAVVSAPGQVPTIEKIDMTGGGEHFVVITLPSGTVAGNLVSSDGGALAATPVELRPGDPRIGALPSKVVVSTDAGGRFLFTEVPEGSYRVAVELKDYLNFEGTAFVHDGRQNQNVGEVVLHKAGALTGKLLGVPKRSEANVLDMVELKDAEGKSVSVDVVRKTGRFSFSSLKAGTYYLEVEIGDKRWTSAMIDVRAGAEPTRFNFKLD